MSRPGRFRSCFQARGGASGRSAVRRTRSRVWMAQEAGLDRRREEIGCVRLRARGWQGELGDRCRSIACPFRGRGIGPAPGLGRSARGVLARTYPAGVAELDFVDPEPWGADAKLVELLGVQGEAGFRALFDGFPDLVGVLWALRDAGGEIVDFTFGYGNPSILQAFRLP